MIRASFILDATIDSISSSAFFSVSSLVLSEISRSSFSVCNFCLRALKDRVPSVIKKAIIINRRMNQVLFQKGVAIVKVISEVSPHSIPSSEACTLKVK